MRWTPERAFLVLGAGFGVLFAVLTPPCEAPDEEQHLARAYVISQGRLSVPGRAPGHRARVPRSLLELEPPPRARERSGTEPAAARYRPASVLARFSQPLAPERRARLESRSHYSPLVYTLPALLLAAARGLEPPPVALLHIARLAGLATWLALGWLAIRALPVRPWSFVLLALTPMSVFGAASVTADSATNGLAWLLFALILRAGFGPEAAVPRGRTAAIAATAALLGLAKPGYAPLAAAILLVPAARFGTAGRRWGAICTVATAALVPGVLWVWAVRLSEPAALAPNVDIARQLASVLADPSGFVGGIAASVQRHAIAWAISWVGVLGRLEVALPGPLYLLVPAAILATALAEGPRPPALDAARRLGLVALFGVCALGVLVLAYLAWTPVGHPRVEGVQGRYFSPMAPLLLLALPFLDRPRWVRPGWITGFAATTLAVSCVALVRHYYAA